MEEVLETYEKAYDRACPVVCMDEQPVRNSSARRVPIPATKEHPERVDYEYERKGTASIFMFAEPLSGFRQGRRLGRAAPRAIGPMKSPICWTPATRASMGSRWFATT